MYFGPGSKYHTLDPTFSHQLECPGLDSTLSLPRNCNQVLRAPFNFSIDGHRKIAIDIEVDGTKVQPVEVDSIPILVGSERHSVTMAVQRADQPNETIGFVL